MKIKTFVVEWVVTVSADVLASPAENNLTGGSRMMLQSWTLRISPDYMAVVEVDLVSSPFLPSPPAPLFLIC